MIAASLMASTNVWCAAIRRRARSRPSVFATANSLWWNPSIAPATHGDKSADCGRSGLPRIPSAGLGETVGREERFCDWPWLVHRLRSFSLHLADKFDEFGSLLF